VKDHESIDDAPPSAGLQNAPYTCFSEVGLIEIWFGNRPVPKQLGNPPPSGASGELSPRELPLDA
jgi:hypothetical protein